MQEKKNNNFQLHIANYVSNLGQEGRAYKSGQVESYLGWTA